MFLTSELATFSGGFELFAGWNDPSQRSRLHHLQLIVRFGSPPEPCFSSVEICARVQVVWLPLYAPILPVSLCLLQLQCDGDEITVLECRSSVYSQHFLCEK